MMKVLRVLVFLLLVTTLCSVFIILYKLFVSNPLKKISISFISTDGCLTTLKLDFRIPEVLKQDDGKNW
ncbi:hypothetical protein GDO81_007475 [Engystomops pustulosus]|uniref:Uncharacterized protein n=1 Tax=Engystomops pustulosus TaxID=76066 RepID=A0AAV7C7B8_ENGPU|nr:hypothetical protein GDO81_007475 [Engystomops pustulosus]